MTAGVALASEPDEGEAEGDDARQPLPQHVEK